MRPGSRLESSAGLTEGGHTPVVLCCSALLSAHLPPPLAEGVRGADLPVAAVAPHVLAFAVGAGVLKSPCSTRAGVLSSVLSCACILLLIGQLRCCCWPLTKEPCEFPSTAAAAACLCACVYERVPFVLSEGWRCTGDKGCLRESWSSPSKILFSSLVEGRLL